MDNIVWLSILKAIFVFHRGVGGSTVFLDRPGPGRYFTKTLTPMKVDIKLSSEKLDFTKPEQRIISLTASDERTILKATIAVPLADDPTSEKLAINAEAVLGDFFPRLIEELRKKTKNGAR